MPIAPMPYTRVIVQTQCSYYDGDQDMNANEWITVAYDDSKDQRWYISCGVPSCEGAIRSALLAAPSLPLTLMCDYSIVYVTNGLQTMLRDDSRLHLLLLRNYGQLSHVWGSGMSAYVNNVTGGIFCWECADQLAHTIRTATQPDDYMIDDVLGLRYAVAYACPRCHRIAYDHELSSVERFIRDHPRTQIVTHCMELTR